MLISEISLNKHCPIKAIRFELKGCNRADFVKCMYDYKKLGTPAGISTVQPVKGLFQAPRGEILGCASIESMVDVYSNQFDLEL